MSNTNSIRKTEDELDSRAEEFVRHHPILGFFMVFVGVPLFALSCVCISIAAAAFPMVWILDRM
ncbi:MAG: hypothetical protein ACI4F3_03995 [Enterocloster sp.]